MENFNWEKNQHLKLNNSMDGLLAEQRKQRKESVNLKTDQQKLSNLKKREKKVEKKSIKQGKYTQHVYQTEIYYNEYYKVLTNQ